MKMIDYLFNNITSTVRKKVSNRIKMGRFPIFMFLAVIFLLGISGNINADTHIWNGEGATDKWNNADNWDVDAVPDVGDDVIFDGTTGASPDKDCDLDEMDNVDSHANQLNSFQVQSGYSGTVTQSHQFYSKDVDLNLTNSTWTVSGAAMEPENFTVTGGTFTITNLGMYGINHFTAIINPPESAILAVGRVAKRAIVIERETGDEVVIQPMMNLTLAVDHRILDGAVAAQFLQDVVRALEQPSMLLW